MIKQIGNAFLFNGKETSLLINVNEVGKVVTEYYGPYLGDIDDVTPLLTTCPVVSGRSVVYDEEKSPNISLNFIHSEFSTPNKGDFGTPSAIIVSEDSCTYDFVFLKAEIRKPLAHQNCPSPYEEDEELILTLVDEAMNVEAELHYITYKDSEVIGRYTVIRNNGDKKIVIKKLASLELGLYDKGYELISFYGSWANEFKKNVDKIGHNRYSFDSITGSSNDYHNPLFLLKEETASRHHGGVYGFNLVYSGNHLEEIEMNSYGQIRIVTGISPTLFEQSLGKDESFATPIAIMTYSDKGTNGVIHSFHDFVVNHVSPRGNAKKPRPIVYNDWEAILMDIKENKIKKLIDKSKKLGIELFVLDDGWFGTRNDDKHGLGDWYTNKKKLPNDIRGLSDYAHKKGLLFGLWFEPEAINPLSDLYKAHPDWAIADPYHKASKGRNQWTLDFTKQEVRDYIYERMATIIEEGQVDFIKWDYNRTMSDIPYNNGTFYHNYILGLYDLLRKIREKFPTLWMENCASGGCRNDLGMFSFFDTAWVSDDTDSFERSLIQGGMLYGYPPSVMSNHVAAKTSNQMLRKTSYATKFDIASIGILGYEFDVTELDPIDEKEVLSQIAFYKENREVFQYGEVDILEEYEDHNRLLIEVHDDNKAAVLYSNLIQKANPARTYLPLVGLDENATYDYLVRREGISLHKFGNMLNYASPIKVHEESSFVNFLARIKDYPIEKFSGSLSGKALNAGALRLAPEWAGDGLSDTTRLLGDFGARLYLFTKKN